MDISLQIVNGVMIKKIYKYIALRFYETGKFESLRKELLIRQRILNNSCVLKNGADITKDALIQNFQNDKSKISIGEKSIISGHLMLFKSGGEISIGDYCYVGVDSKIWSSALISIGNRVLIAHNVNIHDNISHPLNADERHKDFLHIIEHGFQEEVNLHEKNIIIEDDVWIGFNCIILKGVRIGRGAVIGAGTLITKDVPSNAVVVGNPAKIIKYVV